jgi:segregation and condensation protein B
MTNDEDILGAAEAILFAAGEPLETARLAEALELEGSQAGELVAELADLLERRGGGVCLLRLGDKVQLCTRPQYADAVRAALERGRTQPLCPAAMEVLAVVSYHQPVTRAYIEQVRGVDCGNVISGLCQKRLLEDRGRLDLPGRPLLYGTTEEFLKCFCMESLDELPKLPGENSRGEEAAA